MLDTAETATIKYIEHITSLADITLDYTKNIKLYIHSTDSVYKQACIYRGEGNHEKCYILFLKFINLVLKELPAHPSYREIPPSKMNSFKKSVKDIFPLLERLKSELRAHFNRSYQDYLDREQIKREENEERLKEESLRRQKEELAILRKKQIEDYDRDQLEKRSILSPTTTGSYYSPPPVTQEDKLMPSQPPIHPSSPPLFIQTPLLDLQSHPTLQQSPLQQQPPPPPPSFDQITHPETFSLNHCPLKAKLESGAELRELKVPSSIFDRFSSLASEHTRANVEFCGVLFGRLCNDVLTLTTIIIPKQTGTSDTVTMLNEEELWPIAEEKDLLQLGWIHTHPRHPLFLSSVDVHTHCGYQLQLDEAIAIVLAPTHTPNHGVFRLTDPPGMDVIKQCTQKGFHPHQAGNGCSVGSDNPNGCIYRDLCGPRSSGGHVVIEQDLDLETFDLR